MKPYRASSALLPLMLSATLLVAGCSKKTAPQQAENPQQYPSQQAQNVPQQQAPNAPAEQAVNPGSSAATEPAQPAEAPQRQAPPPPAEPAPAPEPARYTIPAGTHIRVTLNQELGSKISRSGENFSATVDDSVVVHGRTLVRSGSPVSGTVIDAKSLGHFKGQAELALRLDSIRSGGERYEIDSSSIERVEKGKGKRTAVLTGGGGGLGALIGGLAGGGKGALIGALAGAGAGAGGSAFTGNKEIVIPAETRLTFRLERSVTVSR